MPDPGDVVTVAFVGVTGTKRRPAVVVSSNLYHANRPDVIVGLLTTQNSGATTPTEVTMEEATLCYEGAWKELIAHEPEFRGKKLKLVVLPEPETALPANSVGSRAPSPLELMKLPLEERDRILSAQAALSEQIYRDDSELTAFEAFGEDDFYEERPGNVFNKQANTQAIVRR